MQLCLKDLVDLICFNLVRDRKIGNTQFLTKEEINILESSWEHKRYNKEKIGLKDNGEHKL